MSRSESKWRVLHASRRSEKEWRRAVTAEPDLMAAEKRRLETSPTDRSANPRRTARLKGKLKDRLIGKTRLPQWQHEISSAGRVWYCVDKADRIVWITKVALTHPRETG
ncbi:MAG: hypothetical protein ABFR89_09815 [Actinomycetota bacterium]